MLTQNTFVHKETLSIGHEHVGKLARQLLLVFCHQAHVLSDAKDSFCLDDSGCDSKADEEGCGGFAVCQKQIEPKPNTHRAEYVA